MGVYGAASPTCENGGTAFGYRDDQGSLSSFQVIGGPTSAAGINDLGTIVGASPSICTGWYMSYEGYSGSLTSGFTPFQYSSDGTYLH